MEPCTCPVVLSWAEFWFLYNYTTEIGLKAMVVQDSYIYTTKIGKVVP